MSGLTGYWWSPLRMPRTLFRQVKGASGAWFRSAKEGGVPFRNFGDELSRLTLEHVLGQSVSWRRARDADVFAIGSIIEHWSETGSQAKIWGSGLRAPHTRRRGPSPTSADCVAVRGVLTREALGLSTSTPLGDPGLFAREVFGMPSQMGDTTVVIPHYSVFATPAGRAQVDAARQKGWAVVSPTRRVRDVALEISGANFVITSSLHGKIVADSLGVPAVLAEFAGSSEPTHKYTDYASVWGFAPRFFNFAEISRSGVAAAEIHAYGEREVIQGRIDGILDDLRSALLENQFAI